VDWSALSENKNAIHILEQNIDKIDWYKLSVNQSIIEVDYKTMSEQRMSLLREELMIKTLHPSRIQKWLDLGMNIDDL
jgi:hypothetical protein